MTPQKKVVDLLGALEASLEQAKADRDAIGPTGPAGTPPGPIGAVGKEPVDLDAIEVLCVAATPGRWEPYFTIHGDPHVTQVGRGAFGVVASIATSPGDYGRANAEFIAAARTDLPALVAELREARTQLAKSDARGMNAEAELDALLAQRQAALDLCEDPYSPMVFVYDIRRALGENLE